MDQIAGDRPVFTEAGGEIRHDRDHDSDNDHDGPEGLPVIVMVIVIVGPFMRGLCY